MPQQSKPPSRVRNYRDLLVWQRAMKLVGTIYRLTNALPPTERFELCSQMRTAAVSIPSNIAEGHGREHLGDYLRLLSIANGSLMELETQLIIAEQLDLLHPGVVGEVLKESAELGMMLAGLIRSLKRRRGENA